MNKFYSKGTRMDKHLTHANMGMEILDRLHLDRRSIEESGEVNTYRLSDEELSRYRISHGRNNETNIITNKITHTL